MLFGLSGGGCFRAVAGLEASLELASSGTVAIPSAMTRVYYAVQGAMVRKNGSRPCLYILGLPSNFVILCESAKHLAEHAHSVTESANMPAAFPIFSQIMISTSASREASYARHRGASCPSRLGK